MWILKSTIIIAIALLSQLPDIHGQNACTPAQVANCGQHTCVQTGDFASCLCNTDFSLKPSGAACDGVTITTTQPTIIIPNQCANAVCPFGSTCIPTNQDPPLYVCLCPNNVIANPNCPTTQIVGNPCSINNPCMNGGTCTLNTITNQAVCVCPTGFYGANCAYGCRPVCDNNWCYNGAKCTNAYGQPYCSCGRNYRGRRCELRYNTHNYVYLNHNPRR